jgi:hypothetical protein
MHRDPWFSWYRRAFFVSALAYAVLLLYAILGQPLLGTASEILGRWVSAPSIVARVQTGAWSLMLGSGATILVCLVIRTIEWIDVRDRDRV